MVKNPPAYAGVNVGDASQCLSREDPPEKEMQPTPVFLPGESHGQRSLVGYIPWGREETRLSMQGILKLCC